MNTHQNVNNTSFGDLGIAPKLLEILDRHNFKVPTPIQQKSIPLGIEGKDIMGIAQTGTGKTLAFGVPMIQRLAQSAGGPANQRGIGLVVLPTRELAIQVNDTYKKIGTAIGLKTAVLIGGESMGKQIKALTQHPHVIIATPGRLIDHLESGRLKLDKVKILVLDEADRMLDMGFAPQINKILKNVPKDRQTMLFSATMPDQIVNIAKSYMSLPLRIEVAPAGTAVELVTQEVIFISRDQKTALLNKVLQERQGSTLVFSRTKHGATKISKTLKASGVTSAEIHSNRSLNQRLEALEGFKIGRYRVLVATDIAARGIDVKGIQLVINYDLPDNPEDYVHRIGRSGRAGMTGHAISFATPDQRNDVRSIERLIRKALAITQTPKELAASETRYAERDSGRSFSPRVRDPQIKEFRGRDFSPRRNTRGGFSSRSGGQGGSARSGSHGGGSSYSGSSRSGGGRSRNKYRSGHDSKPSGSGSTPKDQPFQSYRSR